MHKNLSILLVRLAAVAIIGIMLASCADPDAAIEELPEASTVETEHVIKGPQAWSKQAIWYQILVERFHNGDPSNDPTKLSIQGSYPGFIPDNWTTTPWTQDWYKEDNYFADLEGKLDFSGSPVTSFDAKTALRRYGGDLQGVLDKLDYLQTLGINALYFNPINDAPSMHKYDARHWRHVDVNFGPDPTGDRALIAKENPADPDTWILTSADLMFIEVIAQARSRGMRVILDYSWNHTGHTFWAWQDLLKNQQASEFADWYWVKNFDDPNTPENEFEYRGWFGMFELPEIKETQYLDHSISVKLIEDDIYDEAAKNHILAVTKRWLDPNDDGDTSDGVDGFRLDVAADVPFGFWLDYRSFVKAINPEAYLIGEIWRQQFPDDVFNPDPVLKDKVFDAAMNYRWYEAARRFFGEAPQAILPSEFVGQLKALNQNIDKDYQYAMMNMSASHDSPRLLTSLNNKNKYKYNAKASQNPRYNSNKPRDKAMTRAKLLLAHQFTYIGAPQIWAGDEMGMWGSDDPHNRKPLIWPQYNFENESSHPESRRKSLDEVAYNANWNAYYQSLIAIRRDFPILTTGDIEFIDINDSERVLSYARFDPDQASPKAFVIFNLANKREQIILPLSLLAYSDWTIWRSNVPVRKSSVPAETLLLEAQSSMIILLDNYQGNRTSHQY